MPALVAFHRKWQVASDDFVFPGLMDLLIRVAWLVLACVVYWQHYENLSCPGGHFMRVYLYGDFVVLLLLVFTDVALIQHSMASYMMDEDARKHVRPILYFRLLLEVPEVGWNLLGTVWLFENTVSCPDAPEAIIYMKVLIWLNWSVCLGILIAIAVVFDPLGSSRSKFADSDYERFHVGLHGNQKTRLWENRCKVLFCSCFGNDDMSRDAFKEMAKIMSLLFEDLDFVPSDLAAGLILLNLKSQADAERRNLGHFTDSQEDLLNGVVIRSGTGSHPLQNPHSISVENDPWRTPHMINHFMKYALGSYGWPWFLVAHSKTGLCRLWENILCCGCCVSHPAEIEGDNCCFCHFSALKATVQIETQDVLYTSFRNNVFQTPFFVAIDHSTNSIVIAIRGTMSLRDAMTDLTAEAKPIHDTNFPPEFKVHYGMLLSAQHVLQKLDSLKILEKARSLHPTYGLVITGHSLGAGTAVILGMLLRKEFNQLRCYAYSPPGALMTLEAAVYTEEFTTSVILGDDIVSRLSVPSFDKFKRRLDETIRACRTPKYRILMGGCWWLLVGGVPKNILSPPRGGQSGEEGRNERQLLQGAPEPNYHTYVSLAEESQRLQREAVTKCDMFLPGKILHVTERPIFQSRPDLVEGPRFEWRWADRKDFSEILVSPNMWAQHYPDNVARALADIVNSEPEPFFILSSSS